MLPTPSFRHGFAVTFLMVFTTIAETLAQPSPVSPRPPGALWERRQALDQSIWRNEVEAQRHERVFTQLWDRIRKGDSKLALLGSLQFEQLLIPTNPVSRPLELEIEALTFPGPPDRLSHQDWLVALKRWEEAGIELLSSEWHHQRFQSSTSTRPASSQVSFVLQLRQRAPLTQITITGKLEIQWEKETSEDALQIASIVPTNTEVLRRPLKSGFAKVASIDARTLGEKPFRIHPLIVHDLNQDGLPELILAGVNTVHWNRGQGQFERKPFLKEWRGEIGESAIVADFTGDQMVDFLCITARDRLPVLFQGGPHGDFSTPGRVISGFPIQNASAMTAGDVDGDNDLDVYVTQYRRAYTGGQMPTPFYDANDGYPAYLMVNEGNGRFHDHTESAGLASKRFRRTYSCSFVDLDHDLDLDLMVVSDFAGVDLYENDGRGQFLDVRDDRIDQWHNFGMAHAIADFNLDSQLDFYVIGMSSTTMRRLNSMNLNRPGFPMHATMRTIMGYGNRLYINDHGRFRSPRFAETAARTGWSWGASAFDVDNDGDQDLYVANGFISGESTQDYCTTFWCHDIYTGNSKPNPGIASLLYSAQLPVMNRQISWNGYEHNQLLLNQRAEGFRNIAHLLGTALNQDCRAVASADLNNDGRLDLLVVEERWQGGGSKPQILHVLANAVSHNNHWIGLRLHPRSPEEQPIGALIRLQTNKGEQIRALVTGDSFYTQHAPVAHFGIGSQTEVDSITVTWPSGKQLLLSDPEPDRYHTLP